MIPDGYMFVFIYVKEIIQVGHTFLMLSTLL